MYHYILEVRMGCGCRNAWACELPEDEEPGGDSIAGFFYLIMQRDDVIEWMRSDEHEEKGNEKIDITLRTKVGPAPEDYEYGD